MNKKELEAVELTLLKFKGIVADLLNPAMIIERLYNCGLCLLANEVLIDIKFNKGDYRDKTNPQDYASSRCNACIFPRSPYMTQSQSNIRCEKAIFGNSDISNSNMYLDIDYCRACVEFYEEWLETGKAPDLAFAIAIKNWD